MDLIEIGWTGRSHGLKGEIKLRVQDIYEEDLLAAKSLLIGDPAVPYFVERFRGGGAIIAKFEGLDNREQISLLSNKPLWLLKSQVSEKEEVPETPFDLVLGYTIMAQDYPPLGPIETIVDMPQHYLAELTHEGKTVYIPLHEDLIVVVREEEKILEMVLPEGLLNLGS